MTDPGLFAQYASRYDESVQSVIGASGESVEYFARLKAHLTHGAVAAADVGDILDFGCGVGNTTRCLAAMFPSARLTGFDLSGPSIEVAQSLSTDQRPPLRFVTGAGFGLPFASEAFDLAFASCVFHHIPQDEQQGWANEVFRVVRSGGAFLMFEHNPYNPLTRRVVHQCPFDLGVTLVRPGYARRILRRSGFRVERERYYFFFPRVMRALRPAESLLDWLPLGAQYYVVGRKI